ncbi:orofacial cleft 1 candidate gene 1 protein homolog [Antechinus flavipes]|uniref:orofacial cleft 1 candidate gene 1 protein homolog n=1 Tax=Antechinus flavipes TaxID=38775 RepID=UPI0022359A43|nr:orofacial cleft 1 candidate gene 1 protein homolog [Antechinus flavipes]
MPGVEKKSGHMGDEVDACIAGAGSVFGRLWRKVWEEEPCSSAPRTPQPGLRVDPEMNSALLYPIPSDNNHILLKTSSLQKFQQKALKQTKQKKSKSAEFLMAKEDGAATEGIENPAFNISSTDLSAYQTSEEKVIKHDKPDSTLAAHPQKLRLRACAEPRGNEYSRNYFDPLMDEEINPRQCGMGVSGEG